MRSQMVSVKPEIELRAKMKLKRAKRAASLFGCAASGGRGEDNQPLVGLRSQARPSERITELLTREDNGADPNIRGRGNKLPVICLPGFCSSGLEVKQSEHMPVSACCKDLPRICERAFLFGCGLDSLLGT